MSDLDLADLRQKAEAATPGPWRECGAARGGCVCGFVWDAEGNFPLVTTDTDDEHYGFSSTGPRKIKDAAYIAAANPATILRLLDAIESHDCGGWEDDLLAALTERSATR